MKNTILIFLGISGTIYLNFLLKRKNNIVFLMDKENLMDKDIREEIISELSKVL